MFKIIKICFLFCVLNTKILEATEYLIAFTINPADGKTYRISASNGISYTSSSGLWSFNGTVQINLTDVQFKTDTISMQKVSCSSNYVDVTFGGSNLKNVLISENRCGPPERPKNIVGENGLTCAGRNLWLCSALAGQNAGGTYLNWDCYFPLYVPTDNVRFIMVEWTVAQTLL